jgi:O-methyltransferase
MDNIYITKLFDDWKESQTSKKVRFINKILEKLGMGIRCHRPKTTGWMTNVEQRMNMYHLANQVLFYGVSGDFVELGCHGGQSAALFRTIMNEFNSNKTLHVYDSFAGLPELSEEDGDTKLYHKGWGTVPEETLLANFRNHNLQPPEIHVGFFEDILPTRLPDEIAFAHLDGDLYDSIKVSLEYVYPKMSKGAICLIDDYCDPEAHDCWNELPGVKQACDEFLADKPEEVILLYSENYTHGYFRKL